MRMSDWSSDVCSSDLNPYLVDAVVYSGGGPVQSISPRIDFGAVPSWYSGYLYTDTQLGARPESNALSPQWAGTPGWGSAYKLSGQAAIGWSYKFDKKEIGRASCRERVCQYV